MAKSKNHTAHHKNQKEHKNGIKKPKKLQHMSYKGMEPKFVKNQKFARKASQKIAAAQRRVKLGLPPREVKAKVVPKPVAKPVKPAAKAEAKPAAAKPAAAKAEKKAAAKK